MIMAFCNKCGGETAPEARFCNKCGAQAVLIPQANQPASPAIAVSKPKGKGIAGAVSAFMALPLLVRSIAGGLTVLVVVSCIAAAGGGKGDVRNGYYQYDQIKNMDSSCLYMPFRIRLRGQKFISENSNNIGLNFSGKYELRGNQLWVKLDDPDDAVLIYSLTVRNGYAVFNYRPADDGGFYLNDRKYKR
jgi:hypothetical protein